MTRDEFVGLLNDDLSTEYQSIVQYNLNRPGFLGDSIPWKRGWRHVRPTEAVPA
jgi:hypothetical protein